MPAWGYLCLRCTVWNLLSQFCVSQYFPARGSGRARRDQKLCLAFPFFTPLSFALSNLAVITQTRLSVQIHTHLCKSLACDVYSPSIFSVYSRIASFCLCLIPCSCQSWDTKSYAANVLPVFLHPSPLNYCINVPTNFLILLSVEIASTNEQSLWKPLHRLLHDYTTVRCLWVTGITLC